MRITCLVVVFCLAITVIPVHAQTSFWVENQVAISQGKLNPTIAGLLSHGFSKKIGVYDYFQVDEGYAQCYFGPTFSPASWLQVGWGVGMEEGSSKTRFGGFLYLGEGPYYLLAVKEGGGAGAWHKVEFNTALSPWFGIGFMTQAFRGVGPRIEFNVPKTPLKIWAVFFRDFGIGSSNGIITTRLNF